MAKRMVKCTFLEAVELMMWREAYTQMQSPIYGGRIYDPATPVPPTILLGL